MSKTTIFLQTHNFKNHTVQDEEEVWETKKAGR